MAYEIREKNGTLFQNRYKRTDSQPDMKGEIRIDGKLLEIVAWEKSDRNGMPWYAHKISEREEG